MTVQVQVLVATSLPFSFVIEHCTNPIRKPRSTTLAVAVSNPSFTGRMKLTFISIVEKSSLSNKVRPKAIPMAASASAATRPP